MSSSTNTSGQARVSRESKQPEIVVHRLDAREPFPNNARLPALLYRGVLRLVAGPKAAASIEKTFTRNGWKSGWRDGVYNYHHYHSSAHEVLGCYAGRALIQLGGPEGPVVEFARGDVLVLPAGAAHKSLDTSKDFSVVGAYAEGRAYDMRRGHADEPAGVEARIAEVPLPEHDPVYGVTGPLVEHWKS
jgi:uncharacterized protein YjlB